MAKRGSKSRKLTAQEQSLWQKVTKDVVGQPRNFAPQVNSKAILAKPGIRKNLKSTTTAIHRNASAGQQAGHGNVSKVDPLETGYLLKLMQKFDKNQHPAHLAGAKPTKISTQPYRLVDSHQTAPQNQPLERTIRQKLQRGRADIEARLDLHGLNRDNAHSRLISFLRASWQQGFKTVIVVTGKGDGAIARHSLHSADFFSMPEQRAVLRSSIAEWLNSAEAAQFVIGWQPAHPKHGGGGAVYVRLRNMNKSNG